jgi:hypothetical protein
MRSLIIVLLLILITQPGNNPWLYVVGLILIRLSLSYLTYDNNYILEPMQISGEEIQNIGSIDHQNKMIVRNLEVTETFN